MGRFLSCCRNAGNERIWCCPAASCYPQVLYCLLLFCIFLRSAKSRGHLPTPRGSCAFTVDLRRAPATASSPRRRDEDFRTGRYLRDQGLFSFAPTLEKGKYRNYVTSVAHVCFFSPLTLHLKDNLIYCSNSEVI